MHALHTSMSNLHSQHIASAYNKTQANSPKNHEESNPRERFRSYENHQSPSLISMVTPDDSKIVRSNIIPFKLLMRTSNLLKTYIQNLPLKRVDILGLIEYFYFDNRQILIILYENRIDKNNTRTLHKIKELIEKIKVKVGVNRRIPYPPLETMEYLAYFEFFTNRACKLLAQAYE